MRRVLAYPTWALLLVLVGVSAALRAWAAGTIATPWINPDELIYGDLGRALWKTGHLTLFGEPTRFFSVVYPALAGLPLSLHDLPLGYSLLQGLQAFVMSLTAIPVYFWSRRLTSRGWALVAASLALVPPGLVYSGLIMTEVAFYPAFVLAAWAVWNAIVRLTPRTQALALAAVVLLCAVRLQGFVIVLAYLTAVALEPRRWRAHLPVLGGVAALALIWCAWQLRHGGPITKVLGAYQAAGETHYSPWTVTRFLVYHLGDIVLISGVVPVIALLLLAGTRERDLRVYAAFTLALCGWLALQVGVFASRHIGHTAERNLFELIPVLAVGLVVWLSRGAPRSRVAAISAGSVCVLLLVLFPFESYASLAATPSNFTLVPLYRVTDGVDLDIVIPIAGAALAALALLRPAATVLALFALGVAASVSTGSFVAHEANAVEALTLGPDKQWIAKNAPGPVAFLYSDDLNWETAWESGFWNTNVDRFYDLLTAFVPGGLPQRSVGPLEDGRLVFADGNQAPARYALTSNTVALFGRRLASTDYTTLWRVDQPLRLRRWVNGLDTSSNVESGKLVLSVYACRPQKLYGTLVSDTAKTVEILRNDIHYETVTLRPKAGKEVIVPLAVPKPSGTRLCRVTLRAAGRFSAQSLTLAK